MRSDAWAGALSWCNIQVWFSHNSGLFLRTASLKRAKTSWYYCLFTIWPRGTNSWWTMPFQFLPQQRVFHDTRYSTSGKESSHIFHGSNITITEEVKTALFFLCWCFFFFVKLNLLFFLISAHPVYKMWIIQEPKKLALWNKLHFEEKKTESIEHV